MTTGHFNDSHRGVFRFMVGRPCTRKGRPAVVTEWLRGSVAKLDVEAEARALLADPRDTITHVYVWSLRDQQFVGIFKEQP